MILKTLYIVIEQVSLILAMGRWQCSLGFSVAYLSSCGQLWGSHCVAYLQPVLTPYSGGIAHVILYGISQNQFQVM